MYAYLFFEHDVYGPVCGHGRPHRGRLSRISLNLSQDSLSRERVRERAPRPRLAPGVCVLPSAERQVIGCAPFLVSSKDSSLSRAYIRNRTSLACIAARPHTPKRDARAMFQTMANAVLEHARARCARSAARVLRALRSAARVDEEGPSDVRASCSPWWARGRVLADDACRRRWPALRSGSLARERQPGSTESKQGGQCAGFISYETHAASSCGGCGRRCRLLERARFDGKGEPAATPASKTSNEALSFSCGKPAAPDAARVRWGVGEPSIALARSPPGQRDRDEVESAAAEQARRTAGVLLLCDEPAAPERAGGLRFVRMCQECEASPLVPNRSACSAHLQLRSEHRRDAQRVDCNRHSRSGTPCGRSVTHNPRSSPWRSQPSTHHPEGPLADSGSGQAAGLDPMDAS